MRSLELNLATLPFRNNAPIWALHAVLLAGVAVFTGWNIHTGKAASDKLKALEADLGSVERQLSDLDKREATAVAGARQFDP